MCSKAVQFIKDNAGYQQQQFTFRDADVKVETDPEGKLQRLQFADGSAVIRKLDTLQIGLTAEQVKKKGYIVVSGKTYDTRFLTKMQFDNSSVVNKAIRQAMRCHNH